MIHEWRAGKLFKTRTPSTLDFKIYCDESCHLEHDGSDVMAFGALRCEAESVEPITRSIKLLRQKYNYNNEIKWTKLVYKQLPFYRDLLDLFLESEAVVFKCFLVTNKNYLDHAQFNRGSHGEFYYKMAYYALRGFVKNPGATRIYLDYMDTQGKARIQELLKVLVNAGSPATLSGQTIRSGESQLVQLCDLLIGAISYAKRFLPEDRSPVKAAIIEHIESKLRRDVRDGTPPWEEKFNIFLFSPQRAG
jgi:hypothetical protein